MSKINRKWHLALSLNERKAPMTFNVNERLGKIVTTFIVAFFLINFAGLFFIGKNVANKHHIKELTAENQLLKEKILEMSSIVDSIKTKMQLMQDWENEIRAEQKLDIISNEIRQMGQGGIPKVDTLFNQSSKEFNNSYNSIRNELEILQKRADFNYDTHQDVISHINLKEDFYRNTPSIYPVFGRIASAYGWRRHPLTGKKDFHRGLDIGNAIGTPVYATADGVVKKVGRLRLFGIYVHLKHGYGYETKYAHLQTYVVKKGQKVKKGEIIGYLGNTGRSSGSHLHYEVKRFGKYVNPYYYLNKKDEDIKVSLK